MSNDIDTVELHMTFDDDISWKALGRMEYNQIYQFFSDLLENNSESLQKLSGASTIILVNDKDGRKITVHDPLRKAGVGRCQSIW